MLLHKIRAKLFKTPVGLLPEIKDERDFQVGWFWAGAYEPKQVRTKLKTREPKDQYRNTCGWNATAGMKEIDEGEDLDERSLVIFGKKRGYISGDGFSRLRDNQKILQFDGIAPKGWLQDNRTSWETYSSSAVLDQEIIGEAAKRKIKSYLKVNSVDEVYKAIDEGHPVEIGIDWYTGYNASGGFKLPWIIHSLIGYVVGGHAMYIYGYDTDYHGQRVFIVRNSFGKSYGDNGDLYITEAMLAPNLSKYGAYINYDLDKDIIGWLKIHAGQVVKGEDSPDVYLIEGDTKRKFPDLATFYAWGYKDADIVIVDNDILNDIKDGPAPVFWDGKYVNQIKVIIQQQGNLKPIFSNYFKELF